MVLPYTEVRGYLPLGADLLNGTMTLDAAKVLCNSLSSCMGFTLSAAAARQPHTKHVVWLKAADEWVGHNDHLSFIKNAPACAFEVKRYKKAAHGPYCCEGASCPDEDKYGQLEMTCALPSATPNGMPRCSAGRGRGAAAAMAPLLHYLMAPRHGPMAALHDLVAAQQDLMAPCGSYLRLKRCCLWSYHYVYHCMDGPRSCQHRARSGLAVPPRAPRWRPRRRRANAMADASPSDWRAALRVTLPVTLPAPLPPRQQRGQASTWASGQPRCAGCT